MVTLLTGRLHRGTDGAAGFDLFAVTDVTIWPGKRVLVPTGVRTEFPPSLVGLIRDRSSRSLNQGLLVMAGVIDSDYRDEWQVLLFNAGTEPVFVHHGDRIAQAIFVDICTDVVAGVGAEVSGGTARAGGFGSTG